MRTLIYFKAKLHVLNENENVVCFIAILTQRVYFSSRNLIGRFVGVLLKDDAEKQHIEDQSGKLHLSISCYQVKCLTHWNMIYVHKKIRRRFINLNKNLFSKMSEIKKKLIKENIYRCILNRTWLGLRKFKSYQHVFL